MARPHPAVWRVIHGTVVIYLLVLVFLLFQDVDDARQMMRVRLGLAEQNDDAGLHAYASRSLQTGYQDTLRLASAGARATPDATLELAKLPCALQAMLLRVLCSPYA